MNTKDNDTDEYCPVNAGRGLMEKWAIIFPPHPGATFCPCLQEAPGDLLTQQSDFGN